jgi:dienelactone hydrolase
MLILAAVIIAGVALQAPQPARPDAKTNEPAVPQFEYDRGKPIDLRETGRREERGAVLRDVTYAMLNGERNAATLVTPKTPSKTPTPGILFVHWYGPPAPTSNRTQFIPDAIALAADGVTSLLIDTPWSVPEYFRKRTRTEDYARSVQQVKDLRRALDVLVAQPGIDPGRVAYVGHDFGAMYGTLAAVADRRVTHVVFMAGTASFSDWFLYGPKMEPDARDRFIAELAPLDPVKWLPKLRGPLLLQFADTDEHVSQARREQLIAAAPKGRDARLYKAGHELNEEATRDRLEWLRKELQLPR